MVGGGCVLAHPAALARSAAPIRSRKSQATRVS
jgi:hypothetical protein